MTAASCLEHIPGTLIQAVARDAERDADNVGVFLDVFLGRLGLRPPPAQLLQLPAAFLLDLGAALRLLLWEQAGLQVPTLAGLPPARQALHDVLRSLPLYATGARPLNAPATLASRVLAAFVDHFAWHGRAELDADLLLSAADEDAFLDALAEFLWARRPR
jgi:hypothetical protein